MLKVGVPALAIFLLLSPRAFANMASIHAKALPQETNVLAAYDDAQQLEPYSSSWTIDWKYSIKKDEVAARLSKDLSLLVLASKSHPDNPELLLLTGLIARYAYNLDVDGSYDTAMDSLAEAGKLAPDDVRPPWFRATLLCQTSKPAEGGQAFLAVEAGHPWDQLPAAFWDDYIECASVTSMPAHMLRAADHLQKLHAPDSEMRTFLVGTAQKRFDAFDPNKKYEPKEAWSGGQLSDGDVEFTSTSCGIRMRAHGDWQIQRLELTDGSCIALFGAGPYQAKTQMLHPDIMVMVHRPMQGETLEQYSKKFLNDGKFLPYELSHCPAEQCIAMSGMQPAMYGANGDGHGRIVFFERDQPEFSGLVFESPHGPPTENAPAGASYYRPDQIQQRIPGKLYYLVMLDTAASIEDPALKDFEFFLQNLTVE